MGPDTLTLRVFVVDDEPIIASTLAAILNINGFSARHFTQPLEVLAEAEADIPDVAMPELSGIDLAIGMKAQHPFCKILLFSGQAHTADLLEQARQRGHHFRLLVKPVFPTQLLSEVEKLCDKAGPQPEGEAQTGPAGSSACIG